MPGGGKLSAEKIGEVRTFALRAKKVPTGLKTGCGHPGSP